MSAIRALFPYRLYGTVRLNEKQAFLGGDAALYGSAVYLAFDVGAYLHELIKR